MEIQLNDPPPQETLEELIYENELTFGPLMKSDSPVLVYPIKCTLER